MANTVKEKKASVLPPDEKFWERYSPRHEFPLAAVSSFFIHGLVIGVLLVMGLLLMFAGRSENHRPPSMDVVQLTGAGDGNEGESGAQGLPGDANRTEAAPGPMTNVAENLPDPVGGLNQAKLPEFDIPDINQPDSK